ncbi:hypothetical protein TcCL_ESM04627 [Trypanosoma cruzi]|nr:hypothetical protein TcCL_ESM04627 [Trypanosoma cruzi]
MMDSIRTSTLHGNRNLHNMLMKQIPVPFGGAEQLQLRRIKHQVRRCFRRHIAKMQRGFRYILYSNTARRTIFKFRLTRFYTGKNFQLNFIQFIILSAKLSCNSKKLLFPQSHQCHPLIQLLLTYVNR